MKKKSYELNKYNYKKCLAGTGDLPFSCER